MMKTLQVGITGGIGSGKSLVCKIFQVLGAPVYDADSHAKYLMTTDGILISQIKKEFGDLSFDQEGNLNRKYLSETVFSNQQKLEKLNALVHPRVAEHYRLWVEQHHHHPYVIKEAALMYETNSQRALQHVIVVNAPLELRIKRVLMRDPHRTPQQVQAIIDKQWPEEEKLKRADYIIHNDETRLIIPQVLALHNQFVRLSA